jgi:hypothetical protein
MCRVNSYRANNNNDDDNNNNKYNLLLLLLIFIVVYNFTSVHFLLSLLLLRIPTSGMLHCVALVRTDVSEKCISFIIRVTRIGELGTRIAITAK